MPYSHCYYYPENIVYQFAEACKNGTVDKLDSFFPPHGNFLKKIIRYIKGPRITRYSHVLEYDYAFWFGLERAATTNNVEVIKFILNHPKLRKFKEKKQIVKIREQFTTKKLTIESSSMKEQTFDGPEPDEIADIDITQPIKTASEYGSFESFEIIKNIDIWDYANLDEIYMGFFQNINHDNLNNLLKIPNITEMLKNNLESAVNFIIKGKNEYALVLLKNHFKIDYNLLVNLIEKYDHGYDQKTETFCKWCLMKLLDLSLSEKQNKQTKVKKI